MGTFCGGNTKTWSLSLGILMMVLLFIELIGAIVFMALGLLNKDSKGEVQGGFIGLLANTFYGVTLILVTILGLIVTLFLIVGTVQMKKCLLITWIVCSIILAFAYVNVLGMSIAMVAVGFHFAAFHLAITFLIFCLIIFAQFVVWELRKEAQ